MRSEYEDWVVRDQPWALSQSRAVASFSGWSRVQFLIFSDDKSLAIYPLGNVLISAVHQFVTPPSYCQHVPKSRQPRCLSVRLFPFTLSNVCLPISSTPMATSIPSTLQTTIPANDRLPCPVTSPACPCHARVRLLDGCTNEHPGRTKRETMTKTQRKCWTHSRSLNLNNLISSRFQNLAPLHVQNLPSKWCLPSPLLPLPIADPVLCQRHSFRTPFFLFTLPNVRLAISRPQSCTSNNDKHIVNSQNEITSQWPSPTPCCYQSRRVPVVRGRVYSNDRMSLWVNLHSLTLHECRALWRKGVEPETFLGNAVGSRGESTDHMSPRGGFWELEDVVVNTTAAPVRFCCRTLSG